MATKPTRTRLAIIALLMDPHVRERTAPEIAGGLMTLYSGDVQALKQGIRDILHDDKFCNQHGDVFGVLGNVADAMNFDPYT